MVRLVVVALLLALAGCAQAPVSPKASSNLALQALDEGTHAPAVVALLAQAEQARLAGKITVAQGYLEQARQIEPRNPDILYRKAWLLWQSQNAQEAEPLCQRGLIFAEEGSLVQQRLIELLAQLYEQQGRMMDAATLRLKRR